MSFGRRDRSGVLQRRDQRECRLGPAILIDSVGLQAIEAGSAFGIPEWCPGVVGTKEPADREPQAIVPVGISGDLKGASTCVSHRRGLDRLLVEHRWPVARPGAVGPGG